jgi:hypothetical protein
MPGYRLILLYLGGVLQTTGSDKDRQAFNVRRLWVEIEKVQFLQLVGPAKYAVIPGQGNGIAGYVGQYRGTPAAKPLGYRE